MPWNRLGVPAAAGALTWFALLALGPGHPQRDAGYLALILAGGAGCIAGAVASHRLSGRQRIGWYCLSAMLGLFGLAALLDFITEVVARQPLWSPSAEAVAPALAAPLVTASAGLFISTYLSIARIRTVIDALLVGAPAFLVAWMFGLRDIVMAGGPHQVWPRLAVMLSPMGDVAFLLVIAVLLVRASARDRRPLYVLLAALVFLTLGDYWASLFQLTSPHVVGQPFDAAWVTAFVLIGLAPWYAPLHAVAESAPLYSDRQRFVPYLVIGGTALIALAATLLGRTFDLPLVCDMCIIVLLLAMRQGLILRENLSLTDEIRASELRYRGLVQKSTDVVMVLDVHGVITYVSQPIKGVLGVTPERLIGVCLFDLLEYSQRDEMRTHFGDISSRGGPWPAVELHAKALDGTTRILDAIPNNLLADPTAAGIVLSLRDVTDRYNRADGSRLAENHFDAVTGLANNTLIRDRLEHALARSQRTRDPVGVLVIDIDNFDAINERWGRDVGNQVLRGIAARIRGTLRSMDTPGRLNADEFVVLLEGEVDDRTAGLVARRIIRSIGDPLTVGNNTIRVSASIGATTGDAADTADDLLRQADLALHRAKADGRGDYAVFSPTMEFLSIARLQFEVEMRNAIRNGEIEVYYQPIVDVASGKIVGCEALARWQHPTRGFLPPGEFIELAEETGQIVEIGRHVLLSAARQNATWQDRFDNPDLYVAVNISTRHFNADIVADVRFVLEETGLPAHALVIEVTESALFEDLAESRRQMADLKTLGVRLAMDDFGTGHSSLRYLRELPVDILKIDRAFVSDLGDGDRPSEFIRAITTLARSLELHTVAEGVEEASQVRLLRALGVDTVQGFHLARPCNAEDATQILEKRKIAITKGTAKVRVAKSAPVEAEPPAAHHDTPNVAPAHDDGASAQSQ